MRVDLAKKALISLVRGTVPYSVLLERLKRERAETHAKIGHLDTAIPAATDKVITKADRARVNAYRKDILKEVSCYRKEITTLLKRYDIERDL